MVCFYYPDTSYSETSVDDKYSSSLDAFKSSIWNDSDSCTGSLDWLDWLVFLSIWFSGLGSQSTRQGTYRRKGERDSRMQLICTYVQVFFFFGSQNDILITIGNLTLEPATARSVVTNNLKTNTITSSNQHSQRPNFIPPDSANKRNGGRRSWQSPQTLSPSFGRRFSRIRRSIRWTWSCFLSSSNIDLYYYSSESFRYMLTVKRYVTITYWSTLIIFSKYMLGLEIANVTTNIDLG